jgi:hypothetical protein
MVDRKVVPFDEFYYQLKLMYLFLLHVVYRTVLTDIHIQHNRPDVIILNKQQKQAYLLDIAVPNFHNITQTYNK